jgi:AIPR protein
MPLTPVSGVANSCIAICYASEFLRLLMTEDGVIRQSLFNDNVRDYQGSNNVNREIEETVQKEPDKFSLLNNGVTVVCDEFVPSNRRITIKNPQIVNGCQTSHVLFNAATSSSDIKKILLQVKIIATEDLEIINDIVRGTNRQNTVLEEAFESTRKFHKDLEEFFNVMVVPSRGRIYYERRSRQYQYDPRIKQTEKVNLRILTQYFVGMFLNLPHMSHRHEAKLLQEFESKIYLDTQSKLPYFTTAVTFITLEALLRMGRIEWRSYYSFRPHLMMLFRQIIAGDAPSINTEKAIDEHSTKLLKVLEDRKQIEEVLIRCASVFSECRSQWIGPMMKSASGMKDVPEFTSLLLSKAREEAAGTDVDDTLHVRVAPVNKEVDDKLRGRVAKVIIDRYGRNCGFIERTRWENIFFHGNANRSLDFLELQGALVSYRVVKDPRDGRDVAVDVQRES